MDRRDFLRLGVAGASATVAGCTGRPVAPPPRSSRGVEDFLLRMESGRAAIATATPLSDLLVRRGLDPSTLPPNAVLRDEELFRKSLDALFLTSSFRDLPRDEQLDPRVQERMWGSMDGMNDAVLGIADHLDGLSEDKRRAISDKLRKEPDLFLDAFEVVDDHAAAVGVDPQRRLQLRSIATQVGWRLRTQPLSLFIDEHVAKVQTLAARQNKETLATIAIEAPPQGSEDPSKRPKPGVVVTQVGAILLGCSLVVGALGIALVAGGAGGAGTVVGAFFVTAGALGVIGGLITLLVGLIMQAAS